MYPTVSDPVAPVENLAGSQQAAGVPPQLIDKLSPHVRGNVLAVLRPDPDGKYSRYYFCKSGGCMLAVPCLWFHLIILSPCICWVWLTAKRNVMKFYLVLTERDLVHIIDDADHCCCGGISTTGFIAKTVPLESLTDLETDSRGRGCGNQCVGDMQVVRVDHLGGQVVKGRRMPLEMVGPNPQEAIAFKQLVLSQRDKVRGSMPGMPGAMTIGQPVTMSAHAPAQGQTPQERLAAAKHMLDGGLITSDEYSAKRAEIISAF